MIQHRVRSVGAVERLFGPTTRRIIPDGVVTTYGWVSASALMMCIIVVVLCELKASLSPEVATVVGITRSHEDYGSKVAIGFNITMLALPCYLTEVTVRDRYGNEVSATEGIAKRATYEQGRQGRLLGKDDWSTRRINRLNDRFNDTAVVEEHSVPLSGAGFKDFLSDNDNVFVVFYAPWCVWSRRMMPDWEMYAKKAEAEIYMRQKIRVAKVDCVADAEICSKMNVKAFPTLRFFRRGEADDRDYAKHRDVESWMAYGRSKIEEGGPVLDGHYGPVRSNVKTRQTGCQLSGVFRADRAPRGFHIEARPRFQSVNPTSANLSHVVNDLTFATEDVLTSMLLAKPGEEELQSMSALEGETFIVEKSHTAPHHHLKVISPPFEGRMRRGQFQLLHRMTASNHVAEYGVHEVPEASFRYDLGTVHYVTHRRRKWHDVFLSGLVALRDLVAPGLGKVEADCDGCRG